MTPALCLLLAARLPVVGGRVGEPSGPAAGVEVRLTQPERPAQSVRTGADGVYRFLAQEGPGNVVVLLPDGWVLQGPPSRGFQQALPGEFVRIDFVAHARRVVHGRVIYEEEPLEELTLTDLPAWRSSLRVTPLGLTVTVDMPAGPAEVTRDLVASAPSLASLGLARVPQPAAARPAAAWLAGKALSESEVAAIERLCAVANLDPAFRLVMTGAPHDAKAAQAALVMLRYLTGPGRVAAERISFAVGDVAPAGQLALILMR